MIAKVLLAILAKGHILIEDKPGVGKTTLALAFSKTLQLDCKRVQFTPDVLPADLTGFSIYQKSAEKFIFQPGSLFCQLFLADEINRTSSKTQSALLEVMEEGNVTVDGVTYQLPQPHTVIATQNPIGSIGTQMLPESQMDRFMFQLEMGYPDMQHEIEILQSRENGNPLNTIHPVADAKLLLEMRDAVSHVTISQKIYYYIASLVDATRRHPAVLLGISPRGTLALTDAARGMAFMRGRDYVLADDVAAVCPDVFGHRLVMRAQSQGADTAYRLIQEILHEVPVPRPDGRRM
jgi:MoxR-like ATPase